MITALARAGALSLWLAWPQSQEFYAALDASAFEEARALLEREEDPLERARGRAELFYRARDPLAALEAAEEGLAAHPSDLRLLQRASAASLWLAHPGLATQHSARLEAAVEGAALSPSDRAAWQAQARSFSEQARALVRAEADRDAAVRRARSSALAVLALCVFVLLLCLRAGREDRSGSRPRSAS